jgi:hypothetical protein
VAVEPDLSTGSRQRAKKKTTVVKRIRKKAQIKLL